MPAFNFKERFADAVMNGYKRQTIRAHRRDGRAHCKPGDTLTLYTGMRTKNCRLLATVQCTQVDHVRIETTNMSINGNVLPAILYDRDQVDPTDGEFARSDGFEDFIEMRDWFRDVHGLPFEGVVIYWSEPGTRRRLIAGVV